MKLDEFIKTEKNWILVQAWPGTWKTTLLVWLVEELINKYKLKKEEILILSHVNSTLATISDRLNKKEIHNIKLQTIASFFIENYLIPFKEVLIKINDTNDKIINFLKKVGNNFTEDSIVNEEWGIFWNIITNFNLNLLDFSEKFLKWSSVKYILIDEYQDIEDDIWRVLEGFIKSWYFKSLIVWDKNQAIMYNNAWNLENRYEELKLSKDNLKKTYRFWSNILNEINNICESKINECDKWEGGSYEIIDYNQENIDAKNKDKFWTSKILDLLKEKWGNYWDNLKWKEVCILFQPTTDYKFWQSFNNILKAEIINERLGFINFIRTEKPSNNIHLNKLLLACINWIIDKNSVYYKEIEERFSYLWINKEKRKEIFNKLLELNSNNNVNKLEFLWDFFRKDNYWQLKKYWKEIINNLWAIKLKEIDKKKIINLEIKKDSNKINLYTSPIHSAKWKEWDIVIILDIYFLKWEWIKTFTEVLNSCEQIHKNIYYVAVSRAKERVYTFVKFP